MKIRKYINEFHQTVTVSVKLLAFLWETNKKLYIANILAVTFPAVLPFATAYTFKLIIDSITEANNNGFINWRYFLSLIAIQLILLLCQGVAAALQTYIFNRMWTEVPMTLYQKVLFALSNLDLVYFEDSTFQNTLHRVKESYMWRPLTMIANIFQLYGSVLSLIIAIVAIGKLEWFLVIFILISSVPLFLNRLIYAKKTWGIWEKHSPFRKKFWYLSDLLQNNISVKDIKLYQLSNFFLGELLGIQKKFAQENTKVARKQLIIAASLSICNAIMYIGIEIFVIIATVSRKITIGGLTYYTFILSNYQYALSDFFGATGSLYSNSLYVLDIFTILDKKSSLSVSKFPITISNNKPPKIEFKNVSFTYPGSNKAAIQNVSFTLTPGEHVAFVGKNGSGKTTLIKLLARLYDVTGGEILINGENIKDIDIKSWQKTLGVIFQDFIKYQYSILENIHFGNIVKPVKKTEILKAARLSGADIIAKKLSNSFDQILGTTFEGGKDISAGEWQKIALGRAFYRNSPVVILDEPTSSLDAQAESEIFEKVDRLGKNKTVITISHRFSTVKDVDKIYVMDNGRIIERGNHKQLLKQKGVYTKIYLLQAKRYK